MMVDSAVTDSLGFFVLAMLIISGYAAAFHVLFKDQGINEGAHFATFLKAFETLIYAGIGSFEVDVR